MKILLLAPTYMDLYLPIKENLEKLGNEVTFIEDKTPSFYPYYRRKFLKNIICHTIYFFRNIDKEYKKYWDVVIRDNDLLNKCFDVFFCINGTSLHPYFIDKIIKKNSYIHKSLYLWDTNKCYDFENNITYFDKVYTFDKRDAETLGVNYLPFYYVESSNHSAKINYDAFCIGSLHDNRLGILDSISKQMDTMNLSYIFKVVIIPIENNIINRIKYLFVCLFESESKRMEMKYRMGMIQHKLLSTEYYPIQEFNKLMDQSKVIIDTDREAQSGLTPRLVWALANGKTVITTNSNINLNEYCSEDNIWIIDRRNPIILKGMFQVNKNGVNPNSKIKNLEIKRWLLNFLP